MESLRVADHQSIAETQLRFEVEGQTAVTMMVIEQPAKSSASHFQAQMSFADGTCFRQRLDERNETSPTLDSLGLAQRYRVLQHVLQQTTLLFSRSTASGSSLQRLSLLNATVQGEQPMSRFEAGLDGVTFSVKDSRLLGGFYKGAGQGRRPTAVLVHGLPGIEKNLDIAYRLRDLGWNCLYFHFRGSWGSEGEYSLAGLVEDTQAAVEWARQQPSTDANRVVLIGGSTGGYVALRCGAADARVRAIVGISPLIEPRDFVFRDDMAREFAAMLNAISPRELQRQWEAMAPLSDLLPQLTSRPLLLVTGDRDDLFPPSHYAAFTATLPHVRWSRAEDGNHAFSTCRSWMVQSVTDWLVAEVGT